MKNAFVDNIINMKNIKDNAQSMSRKAKRTIQGATVCHMCGDEQDLQCTECSRSLCYDCVDQHLYATHRTSTMYNEKPSTRKIQKRDGSFAFVPFDSYEGRGAIIDILEDLKRIQDEFWEKLQQLDDYMDMYES